MNHMRLDHYPPEYYQIIEAIAEGEELSMTFPTVNVACRRRNKFYDFRVLLRKEAAAGRLPLPMGLEEVAIERSGTTLRFYPRSTSPLASDMRAMLKLKHAVRLEDGRVLRAAPPEAGFDTVKSVVAQMQDAPADAPADDGGTERPDPPGTSFPAPKEGTDVG